MAVLRACATRASIAMPRSCKVMQASSRSQSFLRQTSDQACTALQRADVEGLTQSTLGVNLNQTPIQVLFCGEELPFSFKYTSEALQSEHGVKVLFLAVNLLTTFIRGTQSELALSCACGTVCLWKCRRCQPRLLSPTRMCSNLAYTGIICSALFSGCQVLSC